MKRCSIEGCGGKLKSRGWCNKHYRRWLRNGDPLAQLVFSDAREAFKARTEWVDGCLIWTGAIGSAGYGRLRVDGRVVATHRYAWELAHGPIPDGLQIDHQCHNRACANTAHLRLATQSQNQSNRRGPADDNLNSGVRNVYRYRNRWRVRIVKDGRAYLFGTYSTVEAAAAVAEEKRREIFGAFAGRGEKAA